MAHPYNSYRDHKVSDNRVSHLTKGYASGGGVHSDEPADKRLVRRMVKESALKLHGGSVSARSDKPNRAAGGMIGQPKKGGKKGSTTVNVIVSGLGKDDASKPPMMPAPVPPPPSPMPPKPPMAGPPPGGPAPMPVGAGLPPPPMMRARGGKVAKREDGGRAAVEETMKQRSNVGSAITPDERKRMKGVIERELGIKPLPTRDPRKLAPDAKGQINIGTGIGYKKGGNVKRAAGGKVSAAQGYTKVQPQNTKETELKNTGRGNVITK